MGATGSVEKKAVSMRVESTTPKPQLKTMASSARTDKQGGSNGKRKVVEESEELRGQKEEQDAEAATAAATPELAEEDEAEHEEGKTDGGEAESEAEGGGEEEALGNAEKIGDTEAVGDTETIGDTKAEPEASADATVEDEKPKAEVKPKFVKGESDTRPSQIMKTTTFTVKHSPNTPFFSEVESAMAEDKGKIHLPRGGTVVNTKLGPIQFGMPPVSLVSCSGDI